jgi:hypothetical protein
MIFMVTKKMSGTQQMVLIGLKLQLLLLGAQDTVTPQLSLIIKSG